MEQIQTSAIKENFQRNSLTTLELCSVASIVSWCQLLEAGKLVIQEHLGNLLCGLSTGK